MNEEELFCKLFPEYVVNGKPLSPYFDLFESGYEQSENRIVDLEKENAELKEENAELKHTTATLRQEKDNVSMHAKAMEVVAKTRSEQFTKAKEIMKHLLDWQYDEYKKSETDKELFKVIAEAEQFLKETE